jgi:hypothetical protein
MKMCAGAQFLMRNASVPTAADTATSDEAATGV